MKQHTQGFEMPSSRERVAMSRARDARAKREASKAKGRHIATAATNVMANALMGAFIKQGKGKMPLPVRRRLGLT